MTKIGTFVSLLFLAAGCVSALPEHPDPPDLYQHVLQFDPDGNALDPQSQRKLNTRETLRRCNDILDRMQAFLVEKKNPNIILYVHGGLTDPITAINMAATHLREIRAADGDCYPLFVVWDSSIIDTYGEHLFQVRQGLKDSVTETTGAFDFPIYFVADILDALARAPVVWIQHWHTDGEAALAAGQALHHVAPEKVFGDILNAAGDAPKPFLPPPATQQAIQAEAVMEIPGNLTTLAFYIELNRLYYQDTHRADGEPAGPPTQIAISIGRDAYHRSDWIRAGTTYIATSPAQLFTSPLIDAVGSPGWREMSRRAETIVEGPSTSEAYVYAEPNSSPRLDTIFNDSGGLDLFVRLLADRCHSSQISPPWKISIIGHSMGTLVINDLLHRQLQREYEGGSVLPVTNIVYMAAACSIRDFSDSVIPYMDSQQHGDLRYYNLSLHPIAELTETNAAGMVPRGSLLCWIDDFLGIPGTPLDRTLGRWDNIVPARDVIPQRLRGRVSMKAFSLLRPNQVPKTPNWEPQVHSDFSDSPFWDEKFWTPEPAFAPNGPKARALEQTRKELAGHAK